MRTILFRGKSVATNEWVEGNLSIEFGKHFIRFEWDDDSSPSGSGIVSVEVHPETVGQATGLNDKNGKMIFEGDVIRYSNPFSKNTYEHICLWDESFACFGLFEQGDKYCKESDWVKIIEVEVISNIHETPETK